MKKEDKSPLIAIKKVLLCFENYCSKFSVKSKSTQKHLPYIYVHEHETLQMFKKTF